MPNSAAVNLFIIGVQKGGTTALHRLLTAHPEIAAGTRKELHFFDNERRDWQASPMSDIESRFDPEAARAMFRLDATPVYCFWPNALARLQAYNPEARLCLMLRHPAYRAASHWRMGRHRKIEGLPFSQAIDREGRRDLGDAAGLPSRHFSYVERGFYAQQVRNLFSLFPREAVFIERTDQLWLDPVGTLHRITDWLGLSSEPLSGLRFLYDPPMMSRSAGTISRGDLERLTTLYADDIRETSALTGIDLTDWLSPDYTEPMPSQIG